MNGPSHSRTRASTHLHPAVGVTIVGLTVWLVLSIWSFAYDGYTDYLLAVATGFFVVAVGFPISCGAFG